MFHLSSFLTSLVFDETQDYPFRLVLASCSEYARKVPIFIANQAQLLQSKAASVSLSAGVVMTCHCIIPRMRMAPISAGFAGPIEELIDSCSLDVAIQIIRAKRELFEREKFRKENVMGRRMPERVFFTIEEIARRWQVSVPVIWQWLMEGNLRIHVWIPLISVFRPAADGEFQLTHWEGYVPLSRHQCRRLFRRKQIHLREFASEGNGASYLIPETAEDISVDSDLAVILHSECLRFERDHHMVSSGNGSIGENREARAIRFKSVHIEGTDYLFGEMQSAVLRCLYESYLEGEPWQNGKQLLGKIGSQSFTLGNLFKHQPVWRRLVHSDRRGFYRMSDEFLATLN